MDKVVNLEELDKNIWNNREQLIMLYFGAPWCDPCQKLKEKLNSKEYMKYMPLMHVIYLNIDIPELNEVSDQYNITSLPTQILITLKDNKIIELDKQVSEMRKKL